MHTSDELQKKIQRSINGVNQYSAFSPDFTDDEKAAVIEVLKGDKSGQLLMKMVDNAIELDSKHYNLLNHIMSNREGISFDVVDSKGGSKIIHMLDETVEKLYKQNDTKEIREKIKKINKVSALFDFLRGGGENEVDDVDSLSISIAGEWEDSQSNRRPSPSPVPESLQQTQQKTPESCCVIS